MTARYPNSAVLFNYRHDVTDLVQAADVNILYDEVTAATTVLGLNPQASANWGTTVTLNTSTTDWSGSNGVAGRLQNIENGLYTAYTSRVSSLGGSTVIPSDVSTVGLVIKSRSSQTADLFQAQLSDGTVVTKIDSSGVLSVNGNTAATLNGTETLTNKTLSGAIISGSSNTVTNLAPASVVVTSGTNIQQYVDAKPTGFYQSTAPTGTIPTGSIWMDSSSSITAFDATNFLTQSSPSVAPTVAGYRKVYSSTSAPTSSDGANGDIWVQYI
ncbi:hypothetical protein UFOVP45_48 [uncultured Caudovirales phage]|uniref:Uncharacterized protein n=1 Tax=uncultured Caudovirales phage TaxID=2100421 RepID=A0A6J5KNB9_9CAUD|nr:hypothetical protein UFOVP45_48 [uncultured Caudovirales phage]